MTLSRGDLFKLQESIHEMTDGEKLEHLIKMLHDEINRAKSWKSHPNKIIYEAHVKNVISLRKDIKALQLQINYAEVDRLVGEEIVKDAQYEDMAETLDKLKKDGE